MKKLILLLSVLLPAWVAAQNIFGVVTDKRTGETLLSATVGLVPETGKTHYTTTDLTGCYRFEGIAPGEYMLQVSYVGYKNWEEKVTVPVSGEKRADVLMVEDVQLLGQVSVQGRATRAEQRGDSLVYNAEAFKVLQGSTAEELLAKMPGVVVEGGSVQAQGEAVRKVLVDGKEFFDGDISLALKNLPADIIASIEVFDKKSEQAEFTGFDDGEEMKTINIITKTGFREGTFGEVYGGYGTENRYRAGGNINFFDDDRRISLLGMSNNINQQNFSQEDLAGVMSVSSGRGKSGGGRRKGGGRSGGGASSASNFMVGSLGGVTASNGAGLNYSDQWGEKVRFTGSYFFNQSSNHTEKVTDRLYFDPLLADMTYQETDHTDMDNWNHRVNMQLDYQIDASNSLQVKPVIGFQTNSQSGLLQGSNLYSGVAESGLEDRSDSRVEAYNLGTSLIFRHRFPVPGRTLSAVFNGTLSDKGSDSYSDYLTRSYGDSPSEELYGQYKDAYERQYSLSGNLVYTEKLATHWQLQAAYRVSLSNAASDCRVYERPGLSDLYDQLNEHLSNVYESDYLTQSGGVGVRFQRNRFNMMVGTDLQYAFLSGMQDYPWQEQMRKDFFSVLPSLTASYRLDRSNSFVFRYRSRSSSPSVKQLQEVVDNSNPLFLSSGNPDLSQQISHSMNLRYIRTTQSGHTFIAMAGATLQEDYVGDSTFVASADMVLPSGVELGKGGQFTKPVNLDGYYSLQSMLTYGFPIDFIRSNVNLSVSASYAHVPTLFNGEASSTTELNLIPKLVLGSNISRNLDFTLSYSATINQIASSRVSALNSNYTSHLAAAKIGWTFWWGFTLQSTFTYLGYTGFEEEVPGYFLWNASLGKKFLKHNQAEIRLEASDLLRQNNSFTHQTGSNYYDYIRSNVLEPYLMLTFAYTIR